ncbi:MAG: AAA family ATPase, partial [Solirubrobacteraceae bacterium]
MAERRLPGRVASASSHAERADSSERITSGAPYAYPPPTASADAAQLRAGQPHVFPTEYFAPVTVAGSDRVVPLLRTKLAVPSSPRLIVRESLIDALSAGPSRPLTLVYGPAGSGKTMLVAQWAASAREKRPVAWLSLETGDNDPARFWMYVIEALRSVLPGIGEASVAMLRAPGVNLVDEALPPLVNELADVSDQLVLVLDDYHAIEDER